MKYDQKPVGKSKQGFVLFFKHFACCICQNYNSKFKYLIKWHFLCPYFKINIKVKIQTATWHQLLNWLTR